MDAARDAARRAAMKSISIMWAEGVTDAEAATVVAAVRQLVQIMYEELLKALELSRKMPQVFTESWQRSIRRQVAEDTRRAILRKAVGDEALEKTEAFKRWLSTQDRRNDILVYLRAENGN